MAEDATVGVTEELKVEMVECIPVQPTVTVTVDDIVRIIWTRNEKPVRESVHTFDSTSFIQPGESV